MKKIISFLLLILFASQVSAANQIDRLSKIKQHEFISPKAKKVTLSNGMTCFLLEDHALPITQGLIIIKAGDIYETVNRTGVSDVTAALLKEGGTQKMSPADVRKYLDEKAISINFSSSLEMMDGSFSSLARMSDETINLFFEMLFEPTFSNDSLSIIKKRYIDALKRDEEISDPISRKKFRELVYGNNDDWGKPTIPSDIKKITQKDIINYYSKFFSPDRMILAMAGDFKVADMVSKLETIAKKYPKKELPAVIMPTVNVKEKAQTKVINKKFTQSAINMGHFGSTRDDPHRFALVLMNDILGGGESFSNRLKNTVRVKNGLAYEVWSAYSFGPKGAPALFQIHAKTRNETSKKAVKLIIEQLQKMVAEGVTGEEFKKAKDAALNKLVFEYEKPFDIVAAAARFVYFGYPENYLDIYKENIQKTTLDEVNEAAKNYLHPDELKIVVVGKYE